MPTAEEAAAPEEVEKNREIILGYLKAKEPVPEIKDYLLCEADVDHYEQRNMIWNKAVNVGEAYCLQQSEVQNQLREIRQETRMVYARIWNLLSRENCFDERKRMGNITVIWKKRAVHPDFISFCSFQYIAMVESGLRYGRKSIEDA